MKTILGWFGIRTVTVFLKSGSSFKIRCKNFKITQRNCKVQSYEASGIVGESILNLDLEQVEAITF